MSATLQDKLKPYTAVNNLLVGFAVLGTVAAVIYSIISFWCAVAFLAGWLIFAHALYCLLAGEASDDEKDRALALLAARRRAEEDEKARQLLLAQTQRQEEEARRHAEEEEARRRAEAEEEARRRAEEEEEARRRAEAEEEARRRAAEAEEEARRAAEEEARQRAAQEEEEARQRAAEEETQARRRAEEEQAARTIWCWWKCTEAKKELDAIRTVRQMTTEREYQEAAAATESEPDDNEEAKELSRVDRRRPSCQLKKEEEQEVPCKDLIIAIGWKQRDHSDLEKRSAKDRSSYLGSAVSTLGGSVVTDSLSAIDTSKFQAVNQREMDASVMMFRFQNPIDDIYAAKPRSEDGAVRHKSGYSGKADTVKLDPNYDDVEQIQVKLNRVDPLVNTIIVAVTTKGGKLDVVEGAYVRLIDASTQHQIFHYEFSHVADAGRLVCKLSRQSVSSWTVKPLDEPCVGRVYRQMAEHVDPFLDRPIRKRKVTLTIQNLHLWKAEESDATPTTGKQVYYCISAYYDGSHDTSKNVKVVVSEDMNMETKKMTLKVNGQAKYVEFAVRNNSRGSARMGLGKLTNITGVGNILDDVAGTVMGHGVPVARGYLRLERDLPIKEREVDLEIADPAFEGYKGTLTVSLEQKVKE